MLKREPTPTTASGLAEGSTSTMLEPHYTVQFLSELWRFSEDTVQRWFEDEPGVLRSGVDGKRGRKRRISIRIPRTVADRVYRRMTGAE